MLFKKKEEIKEETVIDKTPAYLKEDYPYQAKGEVISDLDSLTENELYEIRCPKCEMSLRSQGCNIKSTYKRLMDGNGCLGCGNRELEVKLVDTSKMVKEK